jgi:AcrR family transcriptional regulator
MSKPYHHGHLRSALLEAALTALEQDGELPSLRSLAKACGVSQSAPYRHFESLDQLRVALLIEGFRRLTAGIEAATAAHADPFAALAAGTRCYIQFGLEHPALYTLMFDKRDAVTSSPEASEAGLAGYRTLVDAVAACGVNEPRRAAFVLWTGQHGLIDILLSGLRVPGHGRERDQLVAAEIDMLVGYVRGLVASQATINRGE